MEPSGPNGSGTWPDLTKKRKVESFSESSQPSTSGTSSFEVKEQRVEELKSEVGKTLKLLQDLLECAVCREIHYCASTDTQYASVAGGGKKYAPRVESSSPM